MKASASQSAAGLIVAALALVALASGRVAPHPAAIIRARHERPSSTAVKALRDGQAIDINRAGLADLLLLPGVGPKVAQRIIDERERRGGYTRVDQLLAVKGIGPATLGRLMRWVRIDTSDRTAAMR